jgi:hypothetical protein
MEYRRNRRLEPLMGITHHQLHPCQVLRHQSAQEGEPERPVMRAGTPVFVWEAHPCGYGPALGARGSCAAV